MYACAMFYASISIMYLTLNLLYLYNFFFIYTFVSNVGHLFLYLQLIPRFYFSILTFIEKPAVPEKSSKVKKRLPPVGEKYRYPLT